MEKEEMMLWEGPKSVWDNLQARATLADKALAFLDTLMVTCTNDGHKECEGCPGFGFSPSTGAACGAVYMAPKP